MVIKIIFVYEQSTQFTGSGSQGHIMQTYVYNIPVHIQGMAGKHKTSSTTKNK